MEIKIVRVRYYVHCSQCRREMKEETAVYVSSGRVEKLICRRCFRFPPIVEEILQSEKIDPTYNESWLIKNF